MYDQQRSLKQRHSLIFIFIQLKSYSSSSSSSSSSLSAAVEWFMEILRPGRQGLLAPCSKLLLVDELSSPMSTCSALQPSLLPTGDAGDAGDAGTGTAVLFRALLRAPEPSASESSSSNSSSKSSEW
jgi:hypothetical protein